MNKKLFENTVSLILVQLANYVAPLAILPYLTRVIGIEGFGIVAIVFSILAMLGIIIDFGFGLSGSYWIAKNKEKKSELNEYISSVYTCKLILGFLSFSALVIIYCCTTVFTFDKIILIYIGLNVLAQVVMPTWIFQGLEDMRKITVYMVVTKIVYVFLIFLMVHHHGQQNIVILAMALSNLVGAFIGAKELKKHHIKINFMSFNESYKFLRESFPFFISKSASGIYSNASVFFIGVSSGIHHAALYSSAEKLYQAGQNFTMPVTQALYPYMARTGDKDIFIKFIALIIFPMIIGCATCYYFARDIVVILFGSEFKSSYLILRVFLITSVINFLGANFGYPLFSTINRLDLVNKTTLAATIIYCICISILFALNEVKPINISFVILFVEMLLMLTRLSIYLKWKYK